MKKPVKKTARRKGVTPAQLRQIALSFPGTTEGSSYGKP